MAGVVGRTEVLRRCQPSQQSSALLCLSWHDTSSHDGTSSHLGSWLAKERSEKFRTFAHSGVYAYNELEGQWMWSDTGSCERESPGDIVKIKNPHGWNFAAPTSVL